MPPKSTQKFKKRKGVEEDSLLFLLRALHGKRIVIELESNIEYNGVLMGVDEDMMCSLSDVYRRNMFLNSTAITKVEDTTILGKHIRYVHLPDKIDVMAVMDRHIETITMASKKYNRGVRKAAPKPERSRIVYTEAGERVDIVTPSAGSPTSLDESATDDHLVDLFGASSGVDLFTSSTSAEASKDTTS